MEIQHVIHHQPLSFIKEGIQRNGAKDVRSMYVSGPAYGCKTSL
ncbi:hypothetical protein ES319_D13G012400v1 [Gossypium barbadense]|uniref:Uncharacterized protein n=2 Tax=Gossypium TaxID=3633 RepID=A0A5J5NKJ0_GOSBA|nr:hypothetical protein ES319_D13G012400v1 [Gossypium barbadense]TYG35813.1 hypothetical protein ES288_D13G013200v1 [Gossypium darwinii]